MAVNGCGFGARPPPVLAVRWRCSGSGSGCPCCGGSGGVMPRPFWACPAAAVRLLPPVRLPALAWLRALPAWPPVRLPVLPALLPVFRLRRLRLRRLLPAVRLVPPPPVLPALPPVLPAPLRRLSPVRLLRLPAVPPPPVLRLPALRRLPFVCVVRSRVSCCPSPFAGPVRPCARPVFPFPFFFAVRVPFSCFWASCLLLSFVRFVRSFCRPSGSGCGCG